jgi:hypothetical protein
MPHSAKPRWTFRSVGVALLLSLALHGLLLLVLWYWPARMHSPTLTIQSTRIILDSCVLDCPSSTLLPQHELPADMLGPNVDTTLAPRLEMPPPTVADRAPARPGEPLASDGNGSDHPAADAAGSPLFSLPATAGSVVYVIDRSVSMGLDRKLDFARRELIASLRRLPRSVRFQVIAYNNSAETLFLDGRGDLLPSEPSIIEKAVAHVRALEAAGPSNHFAALRCGLDLRPDVLYFLTDADNLKPEVITAITQRNKATVIHTIELTRHRAPQPDGPLARLARDNRGIYRRATIDDSP